MKAIQIYFAYFVQFLKSRMEYKWNFLASIFSNALVTASGLLFIVLLIDGKVIPDLAGWRREEVLFIYGFSLLPMAMFAVVAPNLYQFGDRYIIQGQLDRVLLRPLNSLSQVLFESFSLESLGNAIVGVVLIIYSSRALHLQFGAIDYLWLLVGAVSGGVILLAVFVILASMSFHFEDRLGIAPPFYNLITFGRYPLPIFNEIIQFVLRWVVPFAFVAFYPATHFLNRTEFRLFCYMTPIVAFLSAAFAGIFWLLGVRRYTSTGS